MAGLVRPVPASAGCVGCRVPSRPGWCNWTDRFATDSVKKFVVKKKVQWQIIFKTLTR